MEIGHTYREGRQGTYIRTEKIYRLEIHIWTAKTNRDNEYT